MKRQAGYALLAEMLVVAVILTTIAAMAVPNLQRIQWNQQQSTARARLEMVAKAQQVIAICMGTQGCVVSPALQAIVPPPGVIVTTGYTFTYSDGWSYSATPIQPQSGQQAMTIGPDGITMCGGAPC